MGRPRKHFPPTNPEDLMRDSSMGDVTDITLPEGVPRNPDGTAKLDGEIGEFQALKIGALDVESAQRNKTVAEAMRDVKLGKSVRWNTDDAMEMFSILRDLFRGEWGSMWLMVDRDDPRATFPPISGKQASDPNDLYRFVEHYHGKSPSARYTIQFRLGGTVRGRSYLVMPDTSEVQVVQPSYGYPQQSYPQGYPSGPNGGWPPPGQGPPQVVVVSPQREPAPPPVPAARPESPPPVHHHYQAPPAAGASNEMTQVLSQLTAQNALMLATMKDLVETSRRPPGYIALPEGHAYPLPAGYIAVPGGMMPSPVGLGQVPAASAQAASAVGPFASFAASQGAPVKTVTETDQIQAAVKSLQTILDGARKIEGLVGSLGSGGGGSESEGPETPNSPRLVQDVGGVHMIIDRVTGKTNWAETVLGAMPKLADAGRSILGEFQKTMEKQAALTSRAVQERTHLASSVEAAARAQTQAAQARAPAHAAQAHVSAKPAVVAPPPVAPLPISRPAGPPVPTVPIL